MVGFAPSALVVELSSGVVPGAGAELVVCAVGAELAASGELLELQAARLAGPTPYDARLAELEVLSAAKVADLLAPGQVLLRLAVAGFGVVLPPPA